MNAPTQTNTPPVPRAVLRFYDAKDDRTRREAALNLLAVLQEGRLPVTRECDPVLKWLRRDQRNLLDRLANGHRYAVRIVDYEGSEDEQAVFAEQDAADAWAEDLRLHVHSRSLVEVVDSRSGKVLRRIEASDRQRMLEAAEAV